jgi:hypothetical protein
MTDSQYRKWTGTKTGTFALTMLLTQVWAASAQFLDEFDGASLRGWDYFTGDGLATMEFQPRRGYASILVDATRDTRNIWWALIKRDVSDALDLNLLSDPKFELRVTARIRLSHAPRRVNLHVNTQKTVDFHTHLMEFDIPEANQWQTISMTTRDFEAEPGDQINAQLALMDWGMGKYRVDVDEFRVDVVDVTRAGADQGEQVPYRPPILPVESFERTISVAHDAIIDLQHPDVNLGRWHVADPSGKAAVLAVSGTHWVILRWPLQPLAGKKIASTGLLELTTHSMQKNDERVKDFGMLRVSEILGGDPEWSQESVTLARFTQRQPLDQVINTQMIIDVDVNEEQGGKTFITISKPVLQRMLDGRTRGLVLSPLGAIHATFYDSQHARGKDGPRLHFNLQQE